MRSGGAHRGQNWGECDASARGRPSIFMPASSPDDLPRSGRERENEDSSARLWVCGAVRPNIRPQNRRYSSPVRRSYSGGSSGTIPMIRLTARGSAWTSIPSMRTRPRVGRRRPDRMRIVVLFPAPFGPRKPKNRPRGTRKETKRRRRRGRRETSWSGLRRRWPFAERDASIHMLP